MSRNEAVHVLSITALTDGPGGLTCSRANTSKVLRFQHVTTCGRLGCAPGDGGVRGLEHNAAAYPLIGRQEGYRALDAAAGLGRQLSHLFPHDRGRSAGAGNTAHAVLYSSDEQFP